MSSGGGFGSSSDKSGSAPGFVDPFSMGILSQNTGLAMEAMGNRYSQLGLAAPGGGAGTAEQMDLGQLPSLVGGIPGMSAATLGQMQTNALTTPTGGSAGSGTGSKGGIGNLFG